MKEMTKATSTAKAYSKPTRSFGPKLKKVDYTIVWKEYESIDEVKAANNMPNDDEVVKFRNQQAKAAARQKAMEAALKAAGYVKPTLENDVLLQLQTIYKALIASGKHDEASARAVAATTLGVEWPNDSDDEDDDE